MDGRVHPYGHFVSQVANLLGQVICVCWKLKTTKTIKGKSKFHVMCFGSRRYFCNNSVEYFFVGNWELGLGLGLDPIFNRLLISCLGFRIRIRSTQIIALIHMHKALQKNILHYNTNF